MRPGAQVWNSLRNRCLGYIGHRPLLDISFLGYSYLVAPTREKSSDWQTLFRHHGVAGEYVLQDMALGVEFVNTISETDKKRQHR